MIYVLRKETGEEVKCLNESNIKKLEDRGYKLVNQYDYKEVSKCKDIQ